MTDQWNDLWDRSSTTLPTSRAEFLELWLERFAPGQKLQAVVVQDANQLVAALPIVGQRWAKVVRAGAVPRNDWLLAGNLLLDETADVKQALRLVAETLNKLPWTIYRFTHIPSNEVSWQWFREALQNAELQIESRSSFDVARVGIELDWEAYQRSWSKNHRKNMARTIRRLEEQGGAPAAELRAAKSCGDRSVDAQGLSTRGLRLEGPGRQLGPSDARHAHVHDQAG